MLTTHPIWQVDLALFRDELEHTSVRLLPVLCAVNQLKEHRICDVQPCELIEGAGREEHFAAMVGILTVRARQHGDGVTTEVFIESPCRPAATHGLIGGHRVVFAVEVGVELRRLTRGAWVVG
jgi:hypothetical protein